MPVPAAPMLTPTTRASDRAANAALSAYENATPLEEDLASLYWVNQGEIHQLLGSSALNLGLGPATAVQGSCRTALPGNPDHAVRRQGPGPVHDQVHCNGADQPLQPPSVITGGAIIGHEACSTDASQPCSAHRPQAGAKSSDFTGRIPRSGGSEERIHAERRRTNLKAFTVAGGRLPSRDRPAGPSRRETSRYERLCPVLSAAIS